MQAMDDPPGSRLFIVCGKSVEADVLQTAFRPFGTVQNVKVIRDKGVAYVKYDKASSAALAMESLNGAVLNSGRGPKLKVLLAESPSTRGMSQPKHHTDQELSSDPDNVPPRSRLFIVVPKTADPSLIQEDVKVFEDLEYCKTDLIATKGVIFCKYSKASSALRALEEVTSKGTLAGYKVKCMLAEPKTKRGRADGMSPEAFPQGGQGKLGEYGVPSPWSNTSVSPGMLAPHHITGNFRIGASPSPSYNSYGQGANGGLNPAQMGIGEYGLGVPGGLQQFTGLAGVNNIGNLGNMPGMSTGLELNAAQAQLGFVGNLNIGGNGQGVGTPMGSVGLGNSSGATGSLGSGGSAISTATFGGMSNYSGMGTMMTPGTSPPISRQRLFVVVHKGVSEDMLARLFRKFSGMEYCDLKRDRTTGKSKGYAYINYSTPEAAAAAIEQLNGIEFPAHSGHRIKVMYAEPLGVRSATAGGPAARPATNSGGYAGMPPVASPGPVGSPMHTGMQPYGGGTPQYSGGGGSAQYSGGSQYTTVNSVQDVSAVQEGLANMSMGGHGMEGGVVADSPLHDVGMNGHRRMTSPSQVVARELMFNVA